MKLGKMNITFILGFFLAVLTSPLVLGEPMYILDSSQGHTSDQLNLSQFWFGYLSDFKDPTELKSSDFNWSLLGRHVTVDKSNYAYSGSELVLGATQSLSDQLAVHVGAGAHQLNFETQSKSSTHFVGQIEGRFHLEKSIFASVKLARLLSYPEILPLQGDPISVRTNLLEAKFHWRPQSRLRSKIHSQERWLEDHNRRIWTDIEVLLELSDRPYRVWLGLGLDHMQNTLTATNYWSPARYLTYGPRFESFWKLSPLWRLSFDGRVFRFKETDFKPGDGYNLRSGIGYGEEGGAILQLFYDTNSSSQSGQAWKSSSFGFGINTNW